jgi:hypothetical protein
VPKAKRVTQARGKAVVPLFILLQHDVLTMQHWPFCLSPETPLSEDAAQHTENGSTIRPHHSNFSLAFSVPGNGADLCTGVDRAAANQPDLWEGQFSPLLGWSSTPMFQVKPHPQTSNALWCLANLHSPLRLPILTSRPRKNMNPLPHVRFTECRIWTSMI